jgi:hypothetical protein
LARKQNWDRVSAETKIARGGYEPFHLEEPIDVPVTKAAPESRRVRRTGSKPPAHADVAMSIVRNSEKSAPSAKAVALVKDRVDQLKRAAKDEKNATTKNAKYSWSEVERRLRALASRVQGR